MNFFYLVLPFTLIWIFCSCGHFRETHYDFVKKDQTQKNVMGAEIEPKLIAKDADNAFAVSAMVYFYGSASHRGPYRLRINAISKDNSHDFFGVEKLIFQIDKQKEKQLNENLLFKKLPFYKSKHSNFFVASYVCPLKIDADGKKNRQIKLKCLVSVSKQGKIAQKEFEFIFISQKTSKTSFISIPNEIKKSFTKKK